MEELAHALLVSWVDGSQDLVSICAGHCHQLLGGRGYPGGGLALQGSRFKSLHDETKDTVSLGEDSRILSSTLLV